MFQNQKIFILGFARSGYQAAKTLIERGCEVVLNDAKKVDSFDQEQVKELQEAGVKLHLGDHPDDLFDASFAYLIKNPGVPINHKYVEKAKKLDIPVINEVEMAYELLPEDVTLIGITGTNGKTTTTTLTYEILKEAFKERVHLTGNIGYPLCSVLNDLKGNDIIVMEVSSQQSENLINFHPHIALMTNLYPAHIDFFGNYDYYKKVKSKMFYNQGNNDIAILNIENQDVMETLKGISSKVKYFSSQHEINGIYLKDGKIYYYGEEILATSDILLSGIHNIENCMASIAMAKELDVSNDIIKKVISTFKGVTHRLEYVDTVGEIKFYNDTEATNIKCTQIALSSFENPTLIILGGLERGQDFNELTPYMKNVKAILAIGECRDRVKEYGASLGIKTFCSEYLKDGFKDLYQYASPNDIILLSPASASWDQYKECEVRGDEFKELVRNLKKCEESAINED